MIWLVFITSLIENTTVSKITFENNNSIKSRELYRVILSRTTEAYSDFNVVQDIGRIVRYYNNLGFFNTEVKPEIKETEGKVELVFRINEGIRPQIKEIRFLNENGAKLSAFLDIEKNNYFLQEKIQKSVERIEAYYKDNGYAFASVTARAIPDSALLIFDIQKGNKYYIRQISIKGLKFSNASVVRHEIEAETGDLYCRKKFLNSQLRIYRLGFFSTINIDLVKIADDTLDVIFDVKELKSRIFNWGVGISLPLSFIISIGLEEMNLFNAGHRFIVQPSFKMNIRKEWEARMDVLYSIPYFTKFRLSPSILPFYWYENKQDFIRKSWGSEFRISRVFSENVQANIANKYKYVDIAMKTELPDTFSGTTNSIKLQLMYDYRNEFFNPNAGIYFVPLIEYAGGIFGGSNHYFRIESEIRHYQNFLLPKKSILAQRLKLGILIPTDGISIDEKYCLGGQYSLRGYPEKSIGPDSLQDEHYGELLLNYNIESRLMIYKSIGMVIFFDAGYIDNSSSIFHTEFLKFSTGAGIRYYTPIGPIRADFGKQIAQKGWEFYLGVYHIF